MFENWEFYTGWVTRHRKRGGSEKYKGRHPAIISDELAAAVLEIRRRRQNERLQNRAQPKYVYLLTPLLYCTCGAQMRGIVSHGTPCYTHMGPKCSYSLTHAEPLEAQVIERFSGWELPPDFERLVQKELTEEMALQQLSEAEQKKLQRLEQRKERAKRLYELGMRDEAWLLETIGELDEEIRKVKPAVRLPYQASHLADIVRQFIRLLAAPEAPRLMVRSMLHSIVERIECNGEAVTLIRPRHWFLEFFRDCDELCSRYIKYPQGNSNPCRHLERVVS